MDSKKDSSKVAPESLVGSSRSDALRQSRLQVSGWNLDDATDSTDDDVGDDDITESVQFKRGETETIKKGENIILDYPIYCLLFKYILSICSHNNNMQIVLREIDMISLKRSREGFNDINFTLGVLDCFLISYVIGAYPQHLCKLYMYYQTNNYFRLFICI